VRILAAADAAAYRVIRLRALTTEPGAFGSSAATEEAFGDAEWLSRVQPADGAVFGVDGADGLVSTGAVVRDWMGSGAYVLVAMWTDADHRGRGHARAIVNAATGFARAKGAPRLICDVTEGNSAAETLYASCGFVRTGGATVRESDGQMHVHMELVL
jgi:GNAT superfamily N-acetyltransferase